MGVVTQWKERNVFVTLEVRCTSYAKSIRAGILCNVAPSVNGQRLPQAARLINI
jgi:hypothetical protein